MVGQIHHNRSDIDPPNHHIEHARTRSLRFLPREGCRSHPSVAHKINLRRCEEREVGL
jgi:hypothetical protein